MGRVGTSRASAVSLLEVIVGAFVLSMVLTAVGAVWIQHQRSYLQARDRMVADFLLQNELERVVAGGYRNLPSLTAEPPSTIDVQRQTAGGLSTARYRTTIAMASNGEGSIRKAVVTVEYPDRGGAPVSVSAETDLFWSQ